MAGRAVKLGIAASAALLLLGGIGAGLYEFLPHHAAKPGRAASAPPPKPIYFAALSDVLVSIPPDSGDPATSFVQFGIQFATRNPKVLVDFDALQPIIKAEIINLLMAQTGVGLENPGTRSSVVQNCLNISNAVLMKNSANLADPPFQDAYITNLVVQD